MKRCLLLFVMMLSWMSFSPALLFAEETVSGQKLEQILENQKKILAKLDEIKAEVQIVKVRASNN